MPPSPISGIADLLYKNVFRRTSTFVLAIIGGGFMFERGFDKIGDTIFETRNKGKLWKDIKHKYETKSDGDTPTGDTEA
ncbi:hypothetical protein RvY_14713 [Ramazzottius varieornatus]|uniref:Complex III subunit 9 n=1 Tax=Ramazzottius varieornatus TaxID=947166 RepID=A0A1D1VXB1_RAMVA|nr:hypothetical protein RvY_14713 [Ramazzottius varieornatus]